MKIQNLKVVKQGRIPWSEEKAFVLWKQELPCRRRVFCPVLSRVLECQQPKSAIRQSVLHVMCYTAWIRRNPSTIHGFCPAKQIVLVQLLRSTFHSTLAIYTGTTADRQGNKAPGKCSAAPLSSRNLDKQTFPQGNYQREQPHSRKQEKSPIPIAFRCSSNACPIMLLYPAAALPLPRHVKHQ